MLYEVITKYMMLNNYEYSKELLHYCLDREIPFLYASSAATYGETDTFIEEPKYEHYRNQLSSSSKKQDFDLTLPAILSSAGNRHPVSLVRKEILDIFSKIGFTVYESYNFV